MEHSFGRLKGHPLSLSPMYLQREDHIKGLIRLLSIGLRLLTLSFRYGKPWLTTTIRLQGCIQGIPSGQRLDQQRNYCWPVFATLL